MAIKRFPVKAQVKPPKKKAYTRAEKPRAAIKLAKPVQPLAPPVKPPEPPPAKLTNQQKAAITRQRNNNLAKEYNAAMSSPAVKLLTMTPSQTKMKNIKEAFKEVFTELQYMDQFSLKTWAMRNPDLFYSLCMKLIPTEITGAGGGPIQIQNVTFE